MIYLFPTQIQKNRTNGVIQTPHNTTPQIKNKTAHQKTQTNIGTH